MKKVLFTMVMLCIVSMNAMAGGLKVVQGDKKFFKTAEGKASLEFVWDGATYNGKMPLTEHYTNLDELEKVAWKWFRDEFNKHNKTVQIVESTEEVKYKITVKVTKMHAYLKLSSFVPGKATEAWGTLTITDAATGEELLVADLKKVDGGANPSPDGTFGDCFKDLAQHLNKLK